MSLRTAENRTAKKRTSGDALDGSQDSLVTQPKKPRASQNMSGFITAKKKRLDDDSLDIIRTVSLVSTTRSQASQKLSQGSGKAFVKKNNYKFPQACNVPMKEHPMKHFADHEYQDRKNDEENNDDFLRMTENTNGKAKRTKY